MLLNAEKKREKKNSYFFGLVKISTLFYYWVVDWVWLDIPWSFMGVVLQQNKFSFHQKYLCYPGYFQEGNGF